jgi:hypothetical protein
MYTFTIKNMKKLLLLLLILAHAFYACSNSQKEQVKHGKTLEISEKKSELKRCDITILKHTEDQINELCSSDIYEFLFTFSKDCSRNIEFSEYSNDLLFKVIEKYPEQVMACLSQKNDLDLAFIIDELSGPLNNVNLKKTYQNIQQVKGDEIIKERVLKALIKAMSDER